MSMKHRRLCDLAILAGVIGLAISTLLRASWGGLQTDPPTGPPPVVESTESPSIRQPTSPDSINTKHETLQASYEESASLHRKMRARGVSPALQSLGLKLKGTVVTGGRGPNVAVIERLGEQRICPEGGQVGRVRIQRVFRSSAIVRIDDQDELIVMEFQKVSTDGPALKLVEQHDGQVAHRADSPIRLDRAEMASSMEDLYHLMKSARIHRYGKGKGPGGFLLTSIKPGSLLAKMGLRNGDMIMGVNEAPVIRAQQAREFFETLVKGGHITLEIKRRGHPKTLQFEIE